MWKKQKKRCVPRLRMAQGKTKGIHPSAEGEGWGEEISANQSDAKEDCAEKGCRPALRLH